MEDWEPYATMWADKRVTTFIGGVPRPRDESWRRFAQSAGLWPLLGYGFWTVADHDDGFLGVAGFAQFERGIAELAGAPECGWAFTPETWGKGIASEAVAAVVAWADANLPATETRCMIDSGNIASAKVAERNGYAAVASLADETRIFARPRP